MSRTSVDEIHSLHREAPLVDIHVHPSLKSWLYNRNPFKKSLLDSVPGILGARASFDQLNRGEFKVIWATHYVPELELLDQNVLLSMASKATGMSQKLRDGSPFSRLKTIITNFEQQVRANPETAAIAKSYNEIETINQNNKIAVVHAVEGGHVLNGELDRLDVLEQLGVVSLTLTHFFHTGIAASVDAIPDNYSLKKFTSYTFTKPNDESLTEFGKECLDRMSDLSILPDITHMTPSAREEVYEYYPPEEPLIATHVGVSRFFDHPMNLKKEEILEIKRRNGVIGVIVCNEWLCGGNAGDGLEPFWKTLNYIRDVTGSWDYVAIGSDFDGFVEPPAPINDAEDIGQLTKFLLNRGLDESTTKKILGKNVMDLMKTNFQRERAYED